MLRAHLDQLALICPVCRLQDRGESALRLGTVIAERDGDLLEGALICDHPSCRREHPILDGIPVVVSNLGAWAQHQLDAVLRRGDLSPWTTSLLGDAAGPGTTWDDERRTVSTYATAHYASDSYAELSRAAFAMAPPPAGTLALDLGCAVGRGTFELAAAGAALAVGVDLSYAMLIVGERARRTGTVSFAQRQIGLVYEPREVPAPARATSDNVAFICADVLNLPFRGATARYALSINIIDCVADPVAALGEVARVVAAGGDAVIATPYDWTASATPLAAWLGGHSQRGDTAGSPEATLRHVLPRLDFAVVAERERVPWRLYVHARSTMEYAVHAVHARRA